MAKKTIKQLEDQIANMEVRYNNLWEKYDKLEKEKRNRDDEDKYKMVADLNLAHHHNLQLAEIIRWQVNPETAVCIINEKDSRRFNEGGF